MAGSIPRAPGRAITVSIAVHVAAFVAVALILARPPATSTVQRSSVIPVHLVYSPTDGGGGGPTGGQQSTRTQSAQIAAERKLVVPAQRAAARPSPIPSPAITDPPPAAAISAPAVDSGIRESIGTLAEVRFDPNARGIGDAAGGDTGNGPGRGGKGRGPGDGNGPGEQGDGLRPGNGVSWPRLIQEVKPNYTPDAMRARVQGLVELEIVVLADGSVGRVNLVRSLDMQFGLDGEAIKAVRRWRFDPARQAGKAVAVRVPVELSFSLR